MTPLYYKSYDEFLEWLDKEDIPLTTKMKIVVEENSSSIEYSSPLEVLHSYEEA